MNEIGEVGDREISAGRVMAEVLPGASVRAAGHLREIAIISGSPAAWRSVPEADRRATLRAIKALGYRYVALDLRSAAPGGE